MSADLSSSVASLVQPISPDAPCGRDARHDTEHEAVRAEIAKLSSVAGGKVDFALVASLGERILTGTSKDLLIACYVAYAWHSSNELDGLARGLWLLRELVAQHGAALYPQRARARLAALEWFEEQTTRKLEGATPRSAQQATELNEAYQGLQRALADVYGDDAPAFASLRTALQRLALSAPTESPAPSPAGEASRTDETPPTSAAEEPPAFGSEDAIELLLAPVSDGSPTGEDVSYSDEYAAIRDEVAKLEAPAGQVVDWQLVFNNSDRLLRGQSKDLFLAAYWTASNGELRGAAGLSAGFALLAGLLDRYWADLWPPRGRIKRRAAALEWAAARAESILARKAPSKDAIGELRGAVEELAKTAQSCFGDSAPALTALQDTLKRIESESKSQDGSTDAAPSPLATPPRPPTTDATPTTSPAREPAAAHAPAASPPSVADLPAVPAAAEGSLTTFIRAVGAALVEAGTRVRAESTADAHAYMLTRVGAWLPIEALPRADAQGKTRIPPPDRRIYEGMVGMAARNDWNALLKQAEGTFVRSPLWLDLQRFVASALAGLGPTHMAALKVVERETTHLLRRHPGLKSLRFSNNSPLADAETLRWLETLSGSGSQVKTRTEEAELSEALRSRLLAGDSEAAAELEAVLRKAPSRRAAFMLRLTLAESLEKAGRIAAAIALYQALERDLDTYALDRWEPDLAYRALHGFRRALSQDDDLGWSRGELRRVCARLAHLSPTAVL